MSQHNSLKSTAGCADKLDKKTNGFVYQSQGENQNYYFVDGIIWTNFRSN